MRYLYDTYNVGNNDKKHFFNYLKERDFQVLGTNIIDMNRPTGPGFISPTPHHKDRESILVTPGSRLEQEINEYTPQIRDLQEEPPINCEELIPNVLDHLFAIKPREKKAFFAQLKREKFTITSEDISDQNDRKTNGNYRQLPKANNNVILHVYPKTRLLATTQKYLERELLQEMIPFV